MKKIYTVLLSVLIMLTVLPSDIFADNIVKIDEQNFPDEVFREFIISYDKDADGWFSAAEIEAVTDIDFTKDEHDFISDFTGIAYFTNLQVFKISFFMN